LSLFVIGFPIYSWFGTWCLIAFVFFWLIRKEKFSSQNYFNKLHWPFLVYFIIHVFGLIWSSDLQSGLDDLQSKSGFLLVPFLFASFSWKKKEVSTLVRLFILGVILMNLLFLSYAGWKYIFENSQSDVFFYANLTRPFKSHPAYAASYCLFCLVYLLDTVFKKEFKTNWNKVLNWNFLGIVFLFFMIIFYAGRMQILACTTVIALQLAWELSRRKKFGVLFLSLIFFLGFSFLASTSIGITGDRMNTAKQNINAPKNIRFKLWDSAIELIKNNVVLGVGTGDVQSELVNRYLVEELPKSAIKSKLNAHNQFLQSFVSLGFFGFLSFLLLLIVPSLWTIKARNFPILALYLIIALGSLTECMLETQKGSVWLAVFGSLFWGREDFQNE